MDSTVALDIREMTALSLISRITGQLELRIGACPMLGQPGTLTQGPGATWSSKDHAANGRTMSTRNGIDGILSTLRAPATNSSSFENGLEAAPLSRFAFPSN